MQCHTLRSNDVDGPHLASAFRRGSGPPPSPLTLLRRKAGLLCFGGVFAAVFGGCSCGFRSIFELFSLAFWPLFFCYFRGVFVGVFELFFCYFRGVFVGFSSCFRAVFVAFVFCGVFELLFCRFCGVFVTFCGVFVTFSVFVVFL